MQLSLSQTPKSISSANYLLRQYGGAAAAYSLQRLDTGSENVVRVRRSSDDAEADFTAEEVSGGALASYCGAGNGFVTTWYDQSGNGRDATQATAASQPQIVASGVVVTDANGNPSMDFDGSNDKLVVSGDSIITGDNTSAWSGFSVQEVTTADVGFVYGNTAGGGVGTSLRPIAGPLWTISSSTSTGDYISRSLALDMVSACYDGAGDANLRVNGGGTPTSGAYTYGAATLDFVIGDWPASPIANSALDGKISEIIIYLSDKSTDRAKIEANIASRYGITLV